MFPIIKDKVNEELRNIFATHITKVKYKKMLNITHNDRNGVKLR